MRIASSLNVFFAIALSCALLISAGDGCGVQTCDGLTTAQDLSTCCSKNAALARESCNKMANECRVALYVSANEACKNSTVPESVLNNCVAFLITWHRDFKEPVLIVAIILVVLCFCGCGFACFRCRIRL